MSEAETGTAEPRHAPGCVRNHEPSDGECIPGGTAAQPRTEAGKRLCAKLNEIGRAPFSGISFPDIEYDVSAIEDQATTEADLRLLVMTTARDAAVVEADRLREAATEARRELERLQAIEAAALRVVRMLDGVEVQNVELLNLRATLPREGPRRASEQQAEARRFATEARRELDVDVLAEALHTLHMPAPWRWWDRATGDTKGTSVEFAAAIAAEYRRLIEESQP